MKELILSTIRINQHLNGLSYTDCNSHVVNPNSFMIVAGVIYMCDTTFMIAISSIHMGWLRLVRSFKL